MITLCGPGAGVESLARLSMRPSVEAWNCFVALLDPRNALLPGQGGPGNPEDYGKITIHHFQHFCILGYFEILGRLEEYIGYFIPKMRKYNISPRFRGDFITQNAETLCNAEIKGKLPAMRPPLGSILVPFL